MSALLMLETRDARSAMVRVVSVTFRSIATPFETSTTPRYIVTIRGSSIANSTAEMPRRSFAKEARRWTSSGAETDNLMTHHLAAGSAVGFIAESGRSDQHSLGAPTIAEPEQRDIDRPLVEQAHQHDGAWTARVVAEIVDDVAVGIERRRRHRDGGKRRERLHLDEDSIGAIEQAVDLGTDRVLEGVLVEALRLRLPGHDEPPRIGDGGPQRLTGEEDDRGLQDRADQPQKGRGNHADFDY